MENKIALGLLKERLDQLSSMAWEERQESLALGISYCTRKRLDFNVDLELIKCNDIYVEFGRLP